MTELPNRCRLVLIVDAATITPNDVKAALKGGDVASVILYAQDGEAPQFEQFCKSIVPTIQDHEAAAIVADNTQAFGRSDADGIMAFREKPKLEDFMARFSPHNIVGCGNIKNRHNALQIGELKPDFLFFGKLDGDIRPEPHHKNLGLAEWWSELVEISAIIMGGSDMESVIECAATNAEFVALGKAVFENADGPEIAVAQINKLLDEHAPIFDEED